MARRGADDAQVIEASRSVLRARRSVETQRRFAKLVSQELERGGLGPAGAERVRRLAATAPFCRLEFRTRAGPADKVLHSCPVCRGGLSRIKNQTLFGGEVTLTLRCAACGYRTGKHKRVPTLYVFHLRA